MGKEGEKGKEYLIEMIAKVLWRGYHELAAIVIELLKKEDKGKLLKIFGKKGELQEWTEKKGIKMRHTKIEVFLEENRMQEIGEETSAEVMSLKLDELRKCDSHEKRHHSREVE